MERFAPDFLNIHSHTFWHEGCVRYADLDVLGHVNNGAIANYFSEARVKLLYQALPGWPNIEGLFVVVNQRFEYFSELHYPNTLRTGLKLIKLGTSSLHLGGILCCDDKVIAAYESISAFVGRDTRRSIPISEDLRKTLMNILHAV